MKKLQYVALFEIKKVQTDNGKEFEKHFREYLEKENIPHFFTFPKHPQLNSVDERFNRTLNDQFLLIWFNTKKAS